MSHEVLISVIIPVFNGARFLTEAVESVWRQGYPKIEIIVVDDGSTDISLDVLKPLAEKGQIKLIIQQNQGVAAARITRLELALASATKATNCPMPSEVMYFDSERSITTLVPFCRTKGWTYSRKRFRAVSSRGP